MSHRDLVKVFNEEIENVDFMKEGLRRLNMNSEGCEMVTNKAEVCVFQFGVFPIRDLNSSSLGEPFRKWNACERKMPISEER